MNTPRPPDRSVVIGTWLSYTCGLFAVFLVLNVFFGLAQSAFMWVAAVVLAALIGAVVVWAQLQRRNR